jgi:hypothetical protein
MDCLATNQSDLMQQFDEFREESRVHNEVTRIENLEKHSDVMTTLSFIVNSINGLKDENKSNKRKSYKD